MPGLLKFLLIAILILWLVRMVARVVFPWVFRKLANKMTEEARKQNSRATESQRTSTPADDGEIRIDYVPPQSKKQKGVGKAGDFVDFEEIK